MTDSVRGGPKKRRGCVGMWVAASFFLDFLVLFHQGKRTKTFIPYYLPDDLTGKIIIKDIQGRSIAEYNAETGENILKIRTQNWAIGVYMYGLQIEGIMYKYKKMVLTGK